VIGLFDEPIYIDHRHYVGQELARSKGEKTMSDKGKFINIEELNGLTHTQLSQLESIGFAGILVREDENSLYVADPQGTWVISRQDVVYLEDWKDETKISSGVSEALKNSGRAVRVGVKEGATIQEIRPWLIKKQPATGSAVRQAFEKVFTLSEIPPALSERTIIGDAQLIKIEKEFARRLGWDPDTVVGARRSNVSATFVVNNGYCDVDCPF
jgi:hypothetical protein